MFESCRAHLQKSPASAGLPLCQLMIVASGPEGDSALSRDARVERYAELDGNVVQENGVWVA